VSTDEPEKPDRAEKRRLARLRLGENIAAIRRFRNLSPDAVAEALGIHRATVWGWQKGKTAPDFPIAVELADLLGVSLDALAGRAPLELSTAAPASQKKEPTP
jgi:transcriptional regulator with XRE-family HTH domain